jgi:hypothetical protein
MKKQSDGLSVRSKRIDILIRLGIALVVCLVIFFFALKPMMSKDYYFEAGSDYKFDNLNAGLDSNSYDVVIIGDGLDGVGAALGSARVGAKTLLVCSSKELGSDIQKTYDLNWSADTSPTGNVVSSDIFRQIRHKAGEGFNIENYKKAIKELIADEQNLTVIYDTRMVDAQYDNGNVISINLEAGQEKKSVKSKRYIDATKTGELLRKCSVPYTLGYSDIGMEGLYPPVKLNFVVNGIDYAQIDKMLKQQGTLINSLLKSYKTSDRNIRISGLNITDQGNSSVIIQSVTARNVNLSDNKQVEKAYSSASQECKDFYKFLKLNVDQFKNSTDMKVAEEFCAPSAYHFNGSYSLSLTDILIGKRFSDRISTASRPVTLTMEDGNRYLLCNPKTFYIPLRSLIPEGLNNVLMTGTKASYSSLVQTAVDSNSSIIGTGYAAGVIAAYSISKNIDMPQITGDQNLDTQAEVEKILRKLGMYMSDIKEEHTDLTDNWSFQYLAKLNNLGLLSAGITNDFKLDKEAKCEDLAYILLNGVIRTSRSAYNYNFDSQLRQYLNEDPLTRDMLARILLELGGKKYTGKDYYSEACNQGLIDKTLQSKLKNKKVLKYPEVYYASVKFIESYTGKTMK